MTDLHPTPSSAQHHQVPAAASRTAAPVARQAAPAAAPAPAAARAPAPSTRAPAGNTDTLAAEIAELKLTIDGLEKERDFYFNKLRDVEVWGAYQCESPW